MSWLFGGFDLKKFKPNLKMAVHRIKLTTSKKTAALRKERREVAELIDLKKFDKARIRVESIIRKDNDIEAQEIIELMCELLHERASLMKAERECPPDLVESVSTIIWAAPRCQIPELATVRKQLMKKYGDEFAAAAKSGTSGRVNTKVIHRLSVQAPSVSTVNEYLTSIAVEFGKVYEPEEDTAEDSVLHMGSAGGAGDAGAGGAGGDDPATRMGPGGYVETAPPAGPPAYGGQYPAAGPGGPAPMGGPAPGPMTGPPPASFTDMPTPPAGPQHPAVSPTGVSPAYPAAYPSAPGAGMPPPGYPVAPPAGYMPPAQAKGGPAGTVPPMMGPIDPPGAPSGPPPAYNPAMAPGATPGAAPGGPPDAGFEELSSRFAALRKS